MTERLPQQTATGCDCGDVGVCPACLAGDLQAVTMERDMLLQVIDAAIKALGPGDDEDSDSPGNMAYAILMHGVNA